MTGTDRSELDPLYVTLRSTGRFVWANLTSVVWISVGWFLAVLPVVTIGPATVGAYRAVLSLRAGDGIDRTAVTRTVRRQFVHATLIGLFPLAVLAVAATYALAYARTGTALFGALALIALNAAVYAWIVSVPTFVELAEGESATRALSTGVGWTARHGVGAAVLAIVTAGLLAVTSLLTVAVVLLFAGVAFAFHVEFVAGVSETDRRPTPTTDT
ncbi:MAG: hypothetical protein QXG03_11630 [Halalkalicoccus sp.]